MNAVIKIIGLVCLTILSLTACVKSGGSNYCDIQTKAENYEKVPEEKLDYRGSSLVFNTPEGVVETNNFTKSCYFIKDNPEPI